MAAMRGAAEPRHDDGGEQIDIADVRQRLRLSQTAFARRYGLSLPTLRSWESRLRVPDAAARAYLTVIARDPERVAAVFAGTSRKAIEQMNWRELIAALDAADAADAANPAPADAVEHGEAAP